MLCLVSSSHCNGLNTITFNYNIKFVKFPSFIKSKQFLLSFPRFPHTYLIKMGVYDVVIFSLLEVKTGINDHYAL